MLNSSTFVIPAYDFASALALSKSESPCGAQAGIHFSILMTAAPLPNPSPASGQGANMSSRLRGNDGI